MTGDLLRYDADGLSMVSNLYLPSNLSSPRPGVLVFPEAFGLGDHARSKAEKLAELGYVALACDIHGDGKTITDMEEVMGVVGALKANPERIRERAGGALAALCARSEVDITSVAAIGFCLGGTISLELARSGADIKGVVGFHSGLATTRRDDAPNIRARVVVCIGADDPGIQPDERAAFEQEMRSGGVDWQMHVYGGVVHSFTNREAAKLGLPDFARYDEKADTRSWATMLGLFDEIF
jgi:dienelactone hydrolase